MAHEIELALAENVKKLQHENVRLMDLNKQQRILIEANEKTFSDLTLVSTQRLDKIAMVTSQLRNAERLIVDLEVRIAKLKAERDAIRALPSEKLFDNVRAENDRQADKIIELTEANTALQRRLEERTETLAKQDAEIRSLRTKPVGPRGMFP